MTPADLLDELAVAIYERPLLREHRESGRIADASVPLSVVMLLIDFDTEVQMNGIIDGFLGNATGRYARETCDALRRIGCPELADQLECILTIAAEAAISHEAIQADRSALPEYAVTSFAQTHGAKWTEAGNAIHRLAHQMDFERLSDQLRAFVADHQAELEPLLSL